MDPIEQILRFYIDLERGKLERLQGEFSSADLSELDGVIVTDIEQISFDIANMEAQLERHIARQNANRT